VPRIRAALARHGARATFFVPAVAAMLHPEEQRALAAEGHEIALHGWIHEVNTRVPPEAERALMLRAADALERIAGRRPVGMRTPSWDMSPATIAIARELGLLYDSSLFADDDPYEIVADGAATGLVELPVEWIRDDAAYFIMNRFGAQRPYTPPEAVLDIFRREFDRAHAEGGLFLLTMHPHVIGYRSRIFILEELLAHVAATGGAWIATHREVAAHCARAAGLRADGDAT
jgi:peptidoglycan/xylan/chitin deacetylase (PgdA/CDA1 family)